MASNTSVKAKFKCTSIISTEYGNKIEMSAVHSSTGENADFTKVTPSGKLEMQIEKDAPACNVFVPGNEYYLTFEKAGKNTGTN